MKMSSMKNRLIILCSLLVILAFSFTVVITEAEAAPKSAKKINPDDPSSVIYLGTKGELAGNPRGVKFLTLLGRRGGSAMAAAALNAIARGAAP